MRIEIPEFSLVALIGASSSGKTHFAKKNFLPTEILSSDYFRGVVSDDENDQKATDDAFNLLHYTADIRLKNMKLTVIDATNVRKNARAAIIEQARRQNVHPVVIVLDMPNSVISERNEAREDRRLPDRVIYRHISDLRRSIKGLKWEGFRFVYVLKSPEEADTAEIISTKMWNDKKDEHGPFDIIGDVHGCFDELVELLEKLGYEKDEGGVYFHPKGRKAAFLGDFADRGPKNLAVIRLVMAMAEKGSALCVAGNHDDKLARKLAGRNVKMTNGLDKTWAELEVLPDTEKVAIKRFLDSLISHYVLDDGKLVISHAGIKDEYIGRGSMTVRSFCLYGDVTGEKDEDGFPVRRNWVADYRGTALNVYGHTPHGEPKRENNAVCIDTGCVFGGSLTALRYPEEEYVSVRAKAVYEESAKDFSQNNEPKDMLRAQDVEGAMRVETKLMGTVVVDGKNSAAALEIMSRFAVDPRWLIYLPPTMSPCRTSDMDGFLEYPTEALGYYAAMGVEKVVCEKKHMGSRAIVILCRDKETVEKRFGINNTENLIGIIYTRTGRRFFNDKGTEQALLERLKAALAKNNFWGDFSSDWVCLDTELLPWSEKAMGLLKKQYAPVGRAGKESCRAAVEALRKACGRTVNAFDVSKETSGQNVDLGEVLADFESKAEALDLYRDAYREYCWEVKSVDDIRLAPFHILAAEGNVFSDKNHLWHLENINKYLKGAEPVFLSTEYISVDTGNEDDIKKATEWWMKITESGGEGMVVKPFDFITKKEGKPVQPAVKCRGKEYLRIIYGPDYLKPEHLSRLKKRSMSRKQYMALREFALGMESLKRFVDNKPLYKVHEGPFAVLALESEPVDPRL